MDIRLAPSLTGRFHRCQSFLDVLPTLGELTQFSTRSRHMRHIPRHKDDRAARLPGGYASRDHGDRIRSFAC